MNCWSNPVDHYNQCQCQQIILSWVSLNQRYNHCNHCILTRLTISTLAFCPPDSWSMGRLCACDGLRRPKPEMRERCWGLKWSASLSISTGISKDSKGILSRCSMMKSYEFISLLKNHAWVCTPFKQPPTFCWLTNRGAWASNLPPKRVWFSADKCWSFQLNFGVGRFQLPPKTWGSWQTKLSKALVSQP